MVDIGSPTFEPEFYLRMKMKVMYFHIAVCVTYTDVRKLWFKNRIEKDLYNSSSPTLCPRWDLLCFL